MKRTAMVGAVLGLTLGICWNALGQVAIEGKTYTGKLTSKKDGKTYEESIVFEKDMMIRSTACEAMGFKAGKYTATEKDAVTTVKGSVTNETGAINEIAVTIKGGIMIGTLTTKMADGTMGETMTLLAQLDTKAKKEEQPAKNEHPSAEHPSAEHPH